MRKVLWIVAALIALGAVEAKAQDFEIGYSSVAFVGVDCTSGTALAVNSSRPTGFYANVAGYRIQNQESTYSVWIGGVSVSTSAASNRGEELKPGASAVYAINKDYKQGASSLITLYCKAADGVGNSKGKLSVVWFGY